MYPKITNYACDNKKMTSVNFGDASINSKDAKAFATRPLSASLDIDRFVKLHDMDPDESGVISFETWENWHHPEWADKDAEGNKTSQCAGFNARGTRKNLNFLSAG